ncbi:MAG TPA: hypothetical protein VGH86_16275 [Phenylobacterium sp.]|jgi:hypothetical protein
MAVHDMNKPYMIYEGPLPPHLARPQPKVEEEDEEFLDALDAPGGISGFATLLAVLLALGVGIAIGVWLTPILRPAPIAALTSTTSPPPALIMPPTELTTPSARIEATPPPEPALPALSLSKPEPPPAVKAKVAPSPKPAAIRLAKAAPKARPPAHAVVHPTPKPNDLALAYAQGSAHLRGTIEDPPH